jgi:hypothetical protein
MKKYQLKGFFSKTYIVHDSKGATKLQQFITNSTSVMKEQRWIPNSNTPYL